MTLAPPPARAHSLDVVLLSRPGCSLCDEARALVERLARRYPLTVAEIDIDSPMGRALAERGNTPFVPAVFLGGEPFAYGRIGERALREEIERCLGGAVPARRFAGRRPARSLWNRIIRGW